jgi:hypothetical protein
VLTLPEARALAESEIKAWAHPEPLVIMGEQEFDIGWAFFYNTERYCRTGELTDMLVGNSPILIDRRTGEVLATGTAHPIEHYVDGHTRDRQQAGPQ